MLAWYTNLLAQLRDLPLEQIRGLADTMAYQRSKGGTNLPTVTLSEATSCLLVAWSLVEDPTLRELFENEVHLRIPASTSVPTTAAPSSDAPPYWAEAMLRHGAKTLTHPDQVLLTIGILRHEKPEAFITVAEIGAVFVEKLGSKPNVSDILTKMTNEKNGKPLLTSAGKQLGSPKAYEVTETGEHQLSNLERMFRGISSFTAAPTAAT
ncbi:hypothetical protein [Luteolibacter soli]|uniref:Transcriptional regulator n=1 Tax=Luteolibacter soli TaxID=3135280 RepID=A0ABU9B068_9BACT